MIKPKHTFSCYFYLFLCALFAFGIHMLTCHVISTEIAVRQLVVYFLCDAVLLCFLTPRVSLFIRNARLVSVDPLKKVIVCNKGSFLAHGKYEFCEFDGYATGRLKAMFRGEERLNKVVMLVKGSYVVEFFDERFIHNIAELEEAIKDLKYVGYQNFNRTKRWRLLLGILKVDQLEL